MNLLLTGGTGTFGRAFIPALLASGKYERIAVFSRDEEKQYRCKREFPDPRLRWFIGDVRDKERLKMALRGVDHVVHAAALKHVPSGESNPQEHVKTNILGAMNLAEAAIEMGVEKVLAISSDKAVEPINLYGATKLCMERLLLAYNNLSGGRTLFSCVRYGNVLGSRGSFLELLRELRAAGKKTYPMRSLDSTRFWIAAEKAGQFVIDRLESMQGREIFVPMMASSTAHELARSVFPEGEPEMVGVPPGEKIHETLISEYDSQYTDIESDHFVIRPGGERRANPWSYRSDQQGVFHLLPSFPRTTEAALAPR